MKKTLLIAATFILISSCSKSPEERLIYDYESSHIPDFANRDFKILSVNQFSVIRASDSLEYFFNLMVGEIWQGETGPSKANLDSMSWAGAIKYFKSRIAGTEDLIKTNYDIFGDDAPHPLLEDQLREERISLSNIRQWKVQAERYADSDQILSIVYDVKYSVNEPSMRDLRTNVMKRYYTDSKGSTFVKTQILR